MICHARAVKLKELEYQDIFVDTSSLGASELGGGWFDMLSQDSFEAPTGNSSSVLVVILPWPKDTDDGG